MSYRRPPQDADWPQWVRQRRAELLACGLPPEAYRSEMAWRLFLDHGYVQSPDRPVEQWWSIHVLTAAQAGRLRVLLAEEYGARYGDLDRTLASLADGGAA